MSVKEAGLKIPSQSQASRIVLYSKYIVGGSYRIIRKNKAFCWGLVTKTGNSK